MSYAQNLTPTSTDLSSTFRLVAVGREKTPSKKHPPPFSLRLTVVERTRLEEMAGSQPLGAYIRSRLFGENCSARRKSRRPSADYQKLALILAELGRSRLASNMNQIAKAANMGTLNISPALVLELQDACRDIRVLRETLITALGLKPESEG